MNMNNNFDILGLIISLILSDNFYASVTNLSQACGLPIPHMRKYISTIFDNKILFSHLSPTADIDDEDIDPLKTAELFLNRIVEGYADNEAIYLVDMDDFTAGYYLLPITPIEAGYINNIYPNLIQNQRTSLFEIKDTIDSIPNNLIKKQDKIQEAISREKKVKFNYSSSKFDCLKIVCSPVAIVHNLTNKILYVKDSENNHYRIDRIISNIEILKDNSNISLYKPDPYQKYFWGTEYKTQDEPVHIKLRISAETSNIIEKIKNDTILRSETCKLYHDDNFYYYEDDILGIQDFRKWLRGYGSSITVLEPQFLIEEMIQSAKNTLMYYGELVNLLPN